MADEVVKIVSETTKVATTIDKIFKYVGYFLSTAAAVTIIGTMFISNFKAGLDRQQMIKSDSTLILEVRSINSRISTIEEDIKEVKEKQTEQISSQNALRSSYVMHIKDDKSLKLDDFLRYMNGIEFEIKDNKLMIDTTKVKQTEFSIKSEKINKAK